jgi:hypothetical protein
MTAATDRPADEETPLLRDREDQKDEGNASIPWRQFSIVLFLQLAEPLTSQVIYPFAPQVCSVAYFPEPNLNDLYFIAYS